MPYNNLVDRTGAQALMPEEVSREIIQGVPQMSAVMTLARRLPDMSRAQRRMPVLSNLLTAYFVSGDTGMKQTTEAAWENKYIDAEELAVIVPIPEAVLDDADYDIWAEIKPRILEAFGRAFDAAVLFGTNAPTSWPDDIKTAATAASHVIDLSTQVAASDDLYDVLLGTIAAGTAGVVGLVEEDGYMVNGHVMPLSMRAKLRGLRDSNGVPIFHTGLQQVQAKSNYALDGEPIVFPRNGSMDATSVLDFAGDWDQLVYAMRQDITYKMLTEAVIQDGAGNIVYNLAQQDMVALRAVMRLGWQVPNPINAVNTSSATRYPFALLVP